MKEVPSWTVRMGSCATHLNKTPAAFEKEFTKRTGITKEMGIDILDSEDFRFGDFREVYKDQPVPLVRILFKKLCHYAPEKCSVEGGSAEGSERTALLRDLGFRTKLEDADISTLLPLYMADKPADPVTVALKKRFGDKPVIAFREDGTVAVTESLQYIADQEQGFPALEVISVNSELTKLWPVGTKPNTMVDEDPLFPGQPLRNGYSLVNNRNWSGIPLEHRQLCRIIVKRGDIDPNNKEAVLRLLERAVDPKTPLSAVYPEAALTYRELKVRDELPKLRIPLGSSVRPNNPFGASRQY